MTSMEKRPNLQDMAMEWLQRAVESHQNHGVVKAFHHWKENLPNRQKPLFEYMGHRTIDLVFSIALDQADLYVSHVALLGSGKDEKGRALIGSVAAALALVETLIEASSAENTTYSAANPTKEAVDSSVIGVASTKFEVE